MLPLGLPEMIAVMIVAVLLFGKRLPEVGRSLGKGIVEFKKGIRGIEEDWHASTRGPIDSYEEPREERRTSAVADAGIPKFEPPTSAPVPQSGYEPQAYRD